MKSMLTLKTPRKPQKDISCFRLKRVGKHPKLEFESYFVEVFVVRFYSYLWENN